MAGFAFTRFSVRLPRSPRFLLTPPYHPPPSGFLQPMPVVEPVVFSDRLPEERFGSVKIHAVNKTKNNGPKWWERNASPNMIDVHSTEDFLNALNQAEDRLVIVEFYGTWCASCKALFPKLCRTVAANSDILFMKVNFDENKPMCKKLNVKFQKINDAIATHTSARCSLGSPAGVWDLNLLEASTTDMPAKSSPG